MGHCLLFLGRLLALREFLPDRYWLIIKYQTSHGANNVWKENARNNNALYIFICFQTQIYKIQPSFLLLWFKIYTVINFLQKHVFETFDIIMIILHFCYLVAGAVRSEKAIFRLVIPGIWLVGTAAVLVADVVASIQYGLDLGKILVRHSSSFDKIINSHLLTLKLCLCGLT